MSGVLSRRSMSYMNAWLSASVASEIIAASATEPAMLRRRFSLSPAPKYWLIIIEKPWVKPVGMPSMNQLSQSAAPMDASASTPTN